MMYAFCKDFAFLSMPQADPLARVNFRYLIYCLQSTFLPSVMRIDRNERRYPIDLLPLSFILFISSLFNFILSLKTLCKCYFAVLYDTNIPVALDLSICSILKKCFVFIVHIASGSVFLYRKKKR